MNFLEFMSKEKSVFKRQFFLKKAAHLKKRAKLTKSTFEWCGWRAVVSFFLKND
jgi:hypothetical protein